MDIGTIIGIIGGAACVVMSVLTSGGTIGGIIDIPSIFMTCGGSYAALLITAPLKQSIGLFKILGRTMKVPDFGEESIIRDLVSLSEKARREGILALEEGIADLSDKFLASGLRLVVDGTDAAIIKNIMESEMSQVEARHMEWIGTVNQWAGFAPGFGMMGTVLGLIGMLNNLEDKSSLGPNMAVALVTTLYGCMMANWILAPMAAKLMTHNNTEMRIKEMIVEGVASIQGGENTRLLAMKLLSYADPKVRATLEPELIKD